MISRNSATGSLGLDFDRLQTLSQYLYMICLSPLVVKQCASCISLAAFQNNDQFLMSEYRSIFHFRIFSRSDHLRRLWSREWNDLSGNWWCLEWRGDGFQYCGGNIGKHDFRIWLGYLLAYSTIFDEIGNLHRLTIVWFTFVYVPIFNSNHA